MKFTVDTILLHVTYLLREDPQGSTLADAVLRCVDPRVVADDRNFRYHDPRDEDLHQLVANLLVRPAERYLTDQLTMAIACARRLADVGLSLLASQNRGDEPTAALLFEAARRCVRLPDLQN